MVLAIIVVLSVLSYIGIGYMIGVKLYNTNLRSCIIRKDHDFSCEHKEMAAGMAIFWPLVIPAMLAKAFGPKVLTDSEVYNEINMNEMKLRQATEFREAIERGADEDDLNQMLRRHDKALTQYV